MRLSLLLWAGIPMVLMYLVLLVLTLVSGDHAWGGGISSSCIARYPLVREGLGKSFYWYPPAKISLGPRGKSQFHRDKVAPRFRLLAVTDALSWLHQSALWGQKASSAGLPALSGSLLLLLHPSQYLSMEVSGATGKESSSPGHLMLACLPVGPPHLRLSERLLLGPEGRRNYWGTFYC